MDIADRITFAPTRSRRIAIRRAVQVLARRARTARLSRCLAATAGDTSGSAMTRHLRMPWSGGYVSLARVSGVVRIADGRDPDPPGDSFTTVIVDDAA